ncbi:hypothetical protein HPB52_022907 [Rhipicephalus sanguineus]|uniref:Uncharacterized protein n=1 Tax=Rhipicephalus sanguineus TaxID=34632 RepID=A0A9D4Q3S1_RHISA|nr:hypothetical protein HPB52_022907 [Rhipicephalus sanguineus]
MEAAEYVSDEKYADVGETIVRDADGDCQDGEEGIGESHHYEAQVGESQPGDAKVEESRDDKAAAVKKDKTSNKRTKQKQNEHREKRPGGTDASGEEREPKKPYTAEETRILCPNYRVPEISRRAHQDGSLHQSRLLAATIRDTIPRPPQPPPAPTTVEAAVALLPSARPDILAQGALPAPTSVPPHTLPPQPPHDEDDT